MKLIDLISCDSFLSTDIELGILFVKCFYIKPEQEAHCFNMMFP